MKNQSGQVFVLAVIVMTLILINTLIIISGSLLFSQNTKHSSSAIQATSLAEAGVDKAIASINATGGTYNGEAETTLGPGTYTVAITNVDASTKLITANGYIPNKANSKAKNTVQIKISKGTGVSFNYGVQVGQGGLTMANNAAIIGSVYANGNITMNNGSHINGDVYVAGGVQPTADQQSDCSSPNCTDFIFGKTVGGNSQLDVAQSFKPASTQIINKVQLKLKKVGNPPNLTVRILANTGTQPDKGAVLTSGVLSASLVTTNYGFVEVAFSSTPTLTSGTTYWILIDTSADNNNYWSWSTDSANGYNNGIGRWSSNWQAASPVYTTIAGDLGFKTFMGGVTTSITGANNAYITGDAHANTLNTLSITKSAYYQVANNITAANYYPGSADPVTQAMPISDGNIQDWKDAALAAGSQSGVSGCPSTLASKKYIGNVSFTNNCIVTVGSPIWITGNLSLDNGSQIKLNSSFGAGSGVIVVDGTITLHNNGKMMGSGTAGSYLVGLSTYNSTSNGVTAIDADNGSSSVILYAEDGIIQLHNNASLQEVTGWKLTLDNGSTVTYNSGLAGLFFTSGPSGTYSVIKGSYQDK